MTTEAYFLMCLSVYTNCPKTLQNACLDTSWRHGGIAEKRNRKRNLPSLCRRRCTVEQRQSTEREDGSQGAEASAIRRRSSQTDKNERTHQNQTNTQTELRDAPSLFVVTHGRREGCLLSGKSSAVFVRWGVIGMWKKNNNTKGCWVWIYPCCLLKNGLKESPDWNSLLKLTHSSLKSDRFSDNV